MTQTVDTAANQYTEDGYVLISDVLPPDLLARVPDRMDAVINGEFETGVPPHDYHDRSDLAPDFLRKVDNAHLSDRTVFEVVSHPDIGKWAAAITGAEWIQVWATQLLVKPPNQSGAVSANNVGWHQDKQYWPYWDGEVFTAWVAISDVTADAGAMTFAQGSHKWGFLDTGDFMGTDLEAQRVEILAKHGQEWREVPAVLPPGGVSFHDKHTFHASGPNRETWPRRSFALHMRTEKSKPIEEFYYTQHLDDPIHCPVIYGG
jgi:ectoine hydroxylase-related dioxygenase (phytanoyl-CoA dioxygenase family)